MTGPSSIFNDQYPDPRRVETTRLADQLERSFRGGAWHGPALAEALEGVDADAAAHRIARGRPHASPRSPATSAFWIDAAPPADGGRGVTDVPPEVDFPPDGAASAGGLARTPSPASSGRTAACTRRSRRSTTSARRRGGRLGPHGARAAARHPAAQRLPRRPDRACSRRRGRGSAAMTPVEQAGPPSGCWRAASSSPSSPRRGGSSGSSTCCAASTARWRRSRSATGGSAPSATSHRRGAAGGRPADQGLPRVPLRRGAPVPRARPRGGGAACSASLLPPPRLAHDGWELAFLWEPRGRGVGDHVDLLRPQRDDEPLHLLLGDVVGKGVAASLLQSHLHALFRALAAPDLPLGELLARVNRLFFEATPGSELRHHGGGAAPSPTAASSSPTPATRARCSPTPAACVRWRAPACRSGSSPAAATRAASCRCAAARRSASTPTAGPRRRRQTTRSSASAAPPRRCGARRGCRPTRWWPPAGARWRPSSTARRGATT